MSKKPSVSPAPLPFQEFDILALPSVVLDSSTKAESIPIYCIKEGNFAKWIKSKPSAWQVQCERQNFKAKKGQSVIITGENGHIQSVIVGFEKTLGLYGICGVVEKLNGLTAHIEPSGITPDDLTHCVTGWWLASYRFNLFKASNTNPTAKLIAPKGADMKRAESLARAVTLIRNLINLPPNALGPKALGDAVVKIASLFDATSTVIENKELLDKNFPLIYAVGDGSERRPRLVDVTWGNPKHPKLTLVGKGVCFDTGGYDIKPSSAMLLMKKDMGGAAMALGLAYMIMALKIPVRLRLLVPCVENSISGRAYRPSDILHSRKGLTVEIGNTDAEGRLILADCLTLASEDNPDLLIDFATLTGAGRVATGYEIAPIYSNNDKLGAELQKLSMMVDDPLWHMPLWEGYKSDVTSPNADLTNSGNNPAGSITAALFLQHFVGDTVPWIHLDHYAWEATGKAGRPKGGADTGMRAVLALIEKRYSGKKK